MPRFLPRFHALVHLNRSHDRGFLLDFHPGANSMRAHVPNFPAPSTTLPCPVLAFSSQVTSTPVGTGEAGTGGR